VAPVGAGQAWIEDVVPLADGELRVLRPPDADALITEEAFEREEFLPYWASLWPSAVALARDLSWRRLRGARTLELGCGLGVPGIAAARAGGRVTASDWSPEAVAATRENAELNGVSLEALVCSWADPGPLVERGPWDLLLASDVLYEPRNGEQLLELLPALLGERTELLLADPDRPPSADFLERAREEFEVRSTVLSERPRVTLHRLRCS
jgi:predicted nicotinamide N-methyase